MGPCCCWRGCVVCRCLLRTREERSRPCGITAVTLPCASLPNGIKMGTSEWSHPIPYRHAGSCQKLPNSALIRQKLTEAVPQWSSPMFPAGTTKSELQGVLVDNQQIFKQYSLHIVFHCPVNVVDGLEQFQPRAPGKARPAGDSVAAQQAMGAFGA